MGIKFIQVAIAVDQVFNTILGGYADETLSARAYRTKHWLRPIIDFIFFFQRDHCFQSYVSEMRRRHLPKGYE